MVFLGSTTTYTTYTVTEGEQAILSCWRPDFSNVKHVVWYKMVSKLFGELCSRHLGSVSLASLETLPYLRFILTRFPINTQNI